MTLIGSLSMKIFISSTYRDLKIQRHIVLDSQSLGQGDERVHK